MSNEFTVSRAHLVYGLALPLAALLGFLLAEPFGSNLFAVMLVVGVLVSPLIMRWYHPLLIATWNAAFIFPFLPGQPPWWMLLAGVGFFFVVLSRCVDAKATMFIGGAVPKALLLIALVVVVTALATGGAGVRAMGGASFGGKRYLVIAGAIMGYFALVGRPIPPHRALACVTVFFLASATSALSNLAATQFAFLGYVVPMGELALDNGSGLDRLSGLGSVAGAIFYVLLIRYGARGLLDVTRFWRLLLLLLVMVAGLFSGFRSALIGELFTFGLVFVIEGLHRRLQYVLPVLALALVAGVVVVMFSAKMPYSVQRTLSFLPVEVSPLARDDARGSTEWRTEMWRAVLPQAREHFFMGQGYAISPDELYMSSVNEATGLGSRSEVAATVRNYHNGLLSVLIPFGIWGVLTFAWFIAVSLRLLHRYASSGRPELQAINRVLFAYFIGKTVMLVFVFGAFENDLPQMVGMIGLAVSLNRRVDESAAAVNGADEYPGEAEPV